MRQRQVSRLSNFIRELNTQSKSYDGGQSLVLLGDRGTPYLRVIDLKELTNDKSLTNCHIATIKWDADNNEYRVVEVLNY